MNFMAHTATIFELARVKSAEFLVIAELATVIAPSATVKKCISRIELVRFLEVSDFRSSNRNFLSALFDSALCS
jgi:hypothetical protein